MTMDKLEELEMVEMSINIDNSSELEVVHPVTKEISGLKSEYIPEIYDKLEKQLSTVFEQKVKNAVNRKQRRTILYTSEKRFPDYELFTKGYLEIPSIIQKLSQKYGDPYNFKCLYDKKTNKFEVEVSWPDDNDQPLKQDAKICECVLL